jgi:hypothetical protein
MSEAKPQDGSTVKYGRDLSVVEKQAMNRLKDASRAFLAELDHIGRLLPDIDRRWAAIARTDMQTACMAACRAVSRPDADC